MIGKLGIIDRFSLKRLSYENVIKIVSAESDEAKTFILRVDLVKAKRMKNAMPKKLI